MAVVGAETCPERVGAEGYFWPMAPGGVVGPVGEKTKMPLDSEAGPRGLALRWKRKASVHPARS